MSAEFIAGFVLASWLVGGFAAAIAFLLGAWIGYRPCRLRHFPDVVADSTLGADQWQIRDARTGKVLLDSRHGGTQ